MPALRKSRSAVEDDVRAELELIRANVAGVRGSLAATIDGLVVAHDLPDVEPTQLAALAAATFSLASRATLLTGCGNFREAVSRGSDGYLAVYAAGDRAIVAVVGTSSLNVAMLQYRAREFIARIAAFAAQIGGRQAATRPDASITDAVTTTDAGAQTGASARAAAGPKAARPAAKAAPTRDQAGSDVRPAAIPALPTRQPPGSAGAAS
jgi:predicted regulator of Ras-like GTPase activity (Roadblock/LC7/MglB family)